MKNFRRILSLVLVLCLCFSLAIHAFAKCMGDCYCTTCTWHYEYDQYDEDYHWEYAQCDNCSANEYAYGSKRAHTFSGNTCTVCGYTKSTGSSGDSSTTCYHTRSYTEWYGCDWYEYCYYCNDLLDYGTTHGTYTYGSWNYYSASQHRRLYSCSDCGEGSYQYASHSTTNQYASYSDSQHSITKYCATCGSTVGSVTYASHSLSYGSWSSCSASQHRRTVSCATCGYSSYGYGDHADSNADGRCDSCSYIMSVTITWDCGNGTTETTTQTCGQALSFPTEPTRENYTFSGWYTEATGGTEVTNSTVFTGTSNTTYYARWTQTFSVTVPTSIPLVMDENGNVSASAAEIVNNSSGNVVVSAVTLRGENGWKIVPYATNMAHQKVDAKVVGFSINGATTIKTGVEEELSLTGDWRILQGSKMPLPYDAVISAVSQAVKNENILTVIFVLQWA